MGGLTGVSGALKDQRILLTGASCVLSRRPRTLMLKVLWNCFAL
jgi:hypothetical protein